MTAPNFALERFASGNDEENPMEGYTITHTKTLPKVTVTKAEIEATDRHTAMVILAHKKRGDCGPGCTLCFLASLKKDGNQ